MDRYGRGRPKLEYLRISIRVRRDVYDEILKTADRRGMTMARFISEAIKDKMPKPKMAEEVVEIDLTENETILP